MAVTGGQRHFEQLQSSFELLVAFHSDQEFIKAMADFFDDTELDFLSVFLRTKLERAPSKVALFALRK